MKKHLIMTLIVGMALSLFMNSEAIYGADDKHQSDTSKAEVTFEGGKLELNSVPVFDFGNQTISSEGEDYTLNDLQPSLQITDERGSGEGWRVTVQASQFNNGSESSLSGATLQFQGGTASNESNEDLPAPVRPTTPILSPPSTSRDMLWRTRGSSGLYLKHIFFKLI